MQLADITPLILCFDEEENIGRTLACLSWASDVVVVDSFSGDQTAEICRQFAQVRLFTRRFDTHAQQWNFGLQECGITSPWVLALDADYAVPIEFVAEALALNPSNDLNGFWVNFRYAVNGVLLAGSLYPPVVSLFRRGEGYYKQDGHTQRLLLKGQLGSLRTRFVHDDRKPLGRWLASQLRYADLECDHLADATWGSLRIQDKLRRLIVIAPWLVPLYCLFLKGGCRDGRAGLIYAFQRCVAESILSLRLLERGMSRNHKSR